MSIPRRRTAPGCIAVAVWLAACARPSDPSSALPSTVVVTAAQPSPHPMSDTLAAAQMLPLVAQVATEDAALLRAHSSVFTYDALPFYAHAGLLRATAMLPTRPVEFRYVYHRGATSAGAPLHPLGTAERVAAANAAEGVHVTADVALAYLRFYLASTGHGGWDGRRLVTDVADVPWLPGTMTDPTLRAAREQVSAKVHPARVDAAVDGGVRVVGTAVRGRTLEAVTWHIAPDGRVTRERVSPLATDAPVVEVL